MGESSGGMSVLIARHLPGDPLVAGLEKAGFRTFTADLVPTSLVSDGAAVALANVTVTDLAAGDYNWLAVTEPAGVWALSQLGRRAGRSLAEVVRRVNLAVTGATTAQVFMAEGIRVVLRPRGAPSVHALMAAWPSLPLLEGDRRALVIDSPLADDTLTRGLRARGWDVDRVRLYDVAPVVAPSAEIAAAWRGGAIDALVIPDPSAAAVVMELLGLPDAETRVIVIGHETALACVAAGLPVSAILPDLDLTALT